MTDNSAEREAERILQEAAAKIEKECPLGESCPVHYRNDDVFIRDSDQYARIITYVGEYAVITEDNHVYDSPAFLLKVAFGLVKKENLPPRWETIIFYVGDGSIGDLIKLSNGSLVKSIRYSKPHGEWDHVQSEHNIVVEALRAGLIDVSEKEK